MKVFLSYFKERVRVISFVPPMRKPRHREVNIPLPTNPIESIPWLLRAVQRILGDLPRQPSARISDSHCRVGGWEMIYTSAVQAVRARLGWCHQCRLHQCTLPTAAPKDRGWWQNWAWNQNQTWKPWSSSAHNAKVMQLFGELNHF